MSASRGSQFNTGLLNTVFDDLLKQGNKRSYSSPAHHLYRLREQNSRFAEG